MESAVVKGEEAQMRRAMEQVTSSSRAYGSELEEMSKIWALWGAPAKVCLIKKRKWIKPSLNRVRSLTITDPDSHGGFYPPQYLLERQKHRLQAIQTSRTHWGQLFDTDAGQAD